MSIITAAAARAAAFLKDMADDIGMIYAEKGMEPFKKPLLISLVIILCVYAFAYSPLRTRVAARSVELDKWRFIEANYSQYESAQARLRAFQGRLPLLKDKEDWLNLILNSTAKTAGVVFDRITTQTEVKAGNFLVVSIDVSMTTTYMKLGRWLADIEKNPMLLRVADARIARVEGQASFNVRADLKLSTIFPNIEAAAKEGGV
jgi:Tfp pilus assembly protein PilO